MGYYSKQAAIYIGGLLCCSSYTFIAPFYPGIAESKGIPFWAIGFMFSLDPIFAFIVSWYLGNNMYKFGRRFILTLGVGLLAGSMIAISFIEFFDTIPILILSFISRMLGGIGFACEMTAGDAILTSDYPGELTKVMGLMEVFVGIGLMVGPLIGSALYIAGGAFLSFMISGIAIAIYTPVCWYLLGEPKPYVISEDIVSSIELISRPKIALDAGVQFAFTFTFGYVFPILEIHLLTFDIGESYIGLCFTLYTLSYSIFSLLAIVSSKKIDARKIMAIGLLTQGIGFSMLGPWKLIYPKEIWVVLVGLFLLGFAQAFMYIPSLPHMIQLAYEEYKYKEDDRLIDQLAGISNIIMNIGEIGGPMAVGILATSIDIETSCAYLALIITAYFVVYLVGSGLTSKKPPENKSGLSLELLDL